MRSDAGNGAGGEHDAEPSVESRTVLPDLSIVVPIYNEIDNLLPLVAATRRALAAHGTSYEIVFVDDGSTDGSRQLLATLADTTREVRVAFLSRNFGQTAAMAAGFDVCRGRRVVTMDGDMQNDPADIPVLLRALDQGYDIVCGWRRDRQDRAVSRKLPSRIANRLISSFTGVRIHDTGCTLKAYRAWVVRQLHLYSDMHRFIPALAAAAGARVGELPVRHHPRRFGRSKYGIGRILRVLTDLLVVRLLVRFASHPMRYFGLASLPLFAMAVVFAFLGLFVEGRHILLLEKWRLTDITSAVLISVTALNLFLLGLLCELIVSVSDFVTRAGTQVEEHGGQP